MIDQVIDSSVHRVHPWFTVASLLRIFQCLLTLPMLGPLREAWLLPLTCLDWLTVRANCRNPLNQARLWSPTTPVTLPRCLLLTLSSLLRPSQPGTFMTAFTLAPWWTMR